jgi:hypothetical protein
LMARSLVFLGLLRLIFRVGAVALLFVAVLGATAAEAQTSLGDGSGDLLRRSVMSVVTQNAKKSDPGSTSQQGAAGPAKGQANRASATNQQPRMSLADKFRYFAKGERLALITPAFSAAYKMANPPTAYPREWRQGGEAFGRNYGDALAAGTANHLAKFLTGAILREDPRYYPSASRNVFSRTFHAIGFTFVDKSDSGHDTLALSNFAGAAAGGFTGNAYLPSGYSNPSHAVSRAGVAFAFMAGMNVGHEFSPELKAVAKKLHIPFVH